MQRINHNFRTGAKILSLALLASAAPMAIRAQAVQLPLSGRSMESAGQVMAVQTTLPAGDSVVQPSVTAAGVYAGSVRQSLGEGGPLRLSVADAVRFGLEANLGVLTSETASASMRAQRLQALSQILPQINGSLGANVVQSNLATMGFAGVLPDIPQIIGPYQYVQAQANFNWSALSLTSLKNVQAASAVQRAVVFNAHDARELVTLAVGGAYWQLLSSSAKIEAARRQVAYAQAICDRAQTQLTAGTTTRVDATRSQVQLQAEQERLLALEGEYAQQKIAFARLIGVAQTRVIDLTESMSAGQSPEIDEEVAIAQAFDKRWDLKSAAAQLHAAEEALRAARAERLPSLAVSGYYGADGTHASQSHGVFAAQGAINFPIFDGGRIRGEIAQAEAARKQRQAEYEDRKARVEQDVRTALIQLHTAEGQLKLADSSRQLARQTREQSQDRYEAGVTSTVEVVQAQQQEASAENDWIASVFAWKLAQLNLARATGGAEDAALANTSTH